MHAQLTVLQGAGLVLAGIVGGAALLTLFLTWISSASGGDSGECVGCAIIGGFLMVGACVMGIWVLTAL